MALVLRGSAWSPEPSMMWARNLMDDLENSHLSLRVSPASCKRWRTALRRLSCTDWSMPWTRISSIWQIVPSRSSRILDKVRWKISGAELMPNGSLLKQYRPNGVTKVVSSRDSSSRGICQNPLLASSLENILLFPSFARLSSTEGMGWTSRWTALLSSVRSTQIRTLPFGLRTGTIPAHHSVGAVTGEMTPCSSIVSIWLFTFGNRGWGSFRGLYRQNGLASARSVMWHSVFSRPRPVKSDGNSALKSVGPELTSSTSFSARFMSPSSTHAFLLSSEHVWLCRT